MTKSNTATVSDQATDLRQRAARARDATGRFNKSAPPNPVAASEEVATAILDLWPAWAAHSGDSGTEEQEAAYEAMQDRRNALIEAADALPATPEATQAKALALAWLHYVSEWRRGRKRRQYTTDGRLAIDIHLAALQRTAPPGRLPVRPRPEASIVNRVDFAAASLNELRAIHEKMQHLSDVAYSMASQGCCKDNAAGELMQWLADELTAVESHAADELQRREPIDFEDRKTRLAAVASRIIYNGDDDETAAFIQDLSAWAAEQARC